MRESRLVALFEDDCGFAIGYAYNPPERLQEGLRALGQELRAWL